VTHLLHIDSSIRGDASVSRKLSARAAAVWRAAHPGGTVTYRDLGRHPLPHLDAAGGMARILPRDQHTAAHAKSWALTEELVSEIKEADTIVLGLPLYNFGAPSSVKAWLDHLIGPGLSHDPQTKAPLLGGREFVVLASRGGGYAEGTTPARVGPRRTMAPARHLPHRPGTALHHRRTHPRPHQPGHDRTDPASGPEPRRGRARHRRPVDPRIRSGLAISEAGPRWQRRADCLFWAWDHLWCHRLAT
jgi:FMN-dependent NADH-azoreductase